VKVSNWGVEVGRVTTYNAETAEKKDRNKVQIYRGGLP